MSVVSREDVEHSARVRVDSNNLNLEALFGEVFSSSARNVATKSSSSSRTRGGLDPVVSSGHLNWDIDVGEIGDGLYFEQDTPVDLGAAPGVSRLQPVTLSHATTPAASLSHRTRQQQTSELAASGSFPSKTEKQIEKAKKAAAHVMKIDCVPDHGVIGSLLAKFGGPDPKTIFSSKTLTPSSGRAIVDEDLKRPSSSAGETSSSTSITARTTTGGILSRASGSLAPVAGSFAERKQQKRAQAHARSLVRNGLPKQELTPELEKELKFLQLRAYADPTRFYKGNDTKELPTHFHMGVEVTGDREMPAVRMDGKATVTLGDGHDLRKKKRKGQSFMAEMLKDQRVQEWNDKRYKEIGAYGQEGSIVKKANTKKKGAHKNAWKKKKK